MRKFVILTICIASLSVLFRPLVYAKVFLGIDLLKKQNFSLLQGKKIGLITNHSGIDREGKSTIDLLFEAPGINLVALFSPEHGIRGTAKDGMKVSDSKDEKTGLPIYSLYGETKRPTEEMLKGLDTILFDIQDVGTRFYTYSTTLAYALEEAAKRDIEFILLDRPNPVTGSIVEGEVLSSEIQHFTAYLKISTRHGMTLGEIANWYNRTSKVNAKLTVVKMEGWKREMWWNETKIKFVPPSPNIRNLRAATLYSGIGGFEATNVSVGRGTKTPFEIFGAPWIDGKILAERLNFLNLAGFEFKPTQFTPENDLYQGELCKGVKVILTDRETARPIDLFVQAGVILRELYPKEFVMRWEEISRVTGSGNFREMLENRYSAETILFFIHEKAARFEQSRKPYLLY